MVVGEMAAEATHSPGSSELRPYLGSRITLRLGPNAWQTFFQNIFPGYVPPPVNLALRSTKNNKQRQALPCRRVSVGTHGRADVGGSCGRMPGIRCADPTVPLGV